MSDPRTDAARRRVAFRLPEEDGVTIRTSSYPASAGEPLPLDVYAPPGTDGTRALPAVLLVTGYNDTGMRRFMGCAAKDMGAFQSWASLLAASGMMAVTYECREPGADGRAALAHIREHAPSLGIDPRRVALWACSGHAPTALGLAMDEAGVACAALLYGYTIDLDGHTEVSEAAATFRFAVPGTGRTLSDLPGAMPILLARAGADQMSGLNACMDRFVDRALAHNLPVTLVNHATGPHAFDLEDDGPGARAAIRQVLAFFAAHLQP